MTIPHGTLIYYSCAIETKQSGGIPKDSDAYDQAIARVRDAMGVTDRKRVRTKPEKPVRTWADPLRTEP